MDRALSRKSRKRIINKQILKIVSFIVFPLILVLFLSNVFSKKIYYKNINTAIAVIGDLQATISGSGVVIANYEELIGSPFRSKIVRVIKHPGTDVNTNDTILILDNETALNELDRLKNELELMTIRQEQQNIELEQKIQDFRISKEIKELKIEGLNSEYLNQSELLKLGGTPKEKVIKAESSLKIARLELKQLITNYDNDLSSRRSGLREIKTEIRIQKTKIRDQENVVSQAYVISPFAGELNWVNDQPGVNISEGQELARVSDYSGYKIRGSASNAWAGQIFSGQKVEIRDKQEKLSGVIENIMPAVSNGMIEFNIRISDGNTENLRPNQQLEIRVILSIKKDALLIPNGPYYTSRGYKDLYIIKNGTAVRRKVLLGASNFDYVEVLEGLEPGEEVILSQLSDKYDREQIRIKK